MPSLCKYIGLDDMKKNLMIILECKSLKLKAFAMKFNKAKKYQKSKDSELIVTDPKVSDEQVLSGVPLSNSLYCDENITMELHYNCEVEDNCVYQIQNNSNYRSTLVKYTDSTGEHLIEVFPPPNLNCTSFLLPYKTSDKPCLVVDLDETLIHSTFITQYPGSTPDFSFGIVIDGELRQVFVHFRPFLKEFLEFIGQNYECVLFTASLETYATTVLQQIDPNHVFKHRLFRTSCSYSSLGLVKDLGKLGRDLNRTLIIDNSPLCYLMQVENGISINTWSGEPNDVELLELIELLKHIGSKHDILEATRQFRQKLMDTV